MSPRKFANDASEGVIRADRRLWFGLGRQLKDARIARKLSVAELARTAKVSRDVAYLVEAGERVSTEAAVRLATALGLQVEFSVTNPRQTNSSRSLDGDVVHSAMGEFEARHFRELGIPTGLDEPHQHYQFAGRADLIAWDTDARALLHIENRTRFPNFQEMAGAYNAKRAYLGAALAERLAVGRWRSETHVIAALWSSEVLHALRLRTDSFRSLCPDPSDAFHGWWSGRPPTASSTSLLVVLDPLATPGRRPFIGLEQALSASTRPRHAGYSDAASGLVD